MKKFLFWATVVGASLTGCVNDVETVLSQEDNAQPITFEVGKYKPSSRTEVAFPTDSTFGTFAYYENTVQAGHSIYMNNVEITHKVNDGAKFWSAKDGEYMWPHQGHLDFVSYAPYEAYKIEVDANGDTRKTLSNYVPQLSNDQTALIYRNLKVDAANPIDLLYSDKAVNQKANTSHYNYTGVPTLFHHALAKLSFKAKVQRFNNSASSPNAVTSWSVVLNSVTIKGIYDEGTVTLTIPSHPSSSAGASVQAWRKGDENDLQIWDETGSVTSKIWSPVNGQVLSNSENFVIGSSAQELAHNYFVLPQKLSANQQTITLNYTVTSKSPEGQVGVATYTPTKSFADFTSVTAWEMGKHITYVIEIDPAGDIINFAPAIEDWITTGNGTQGNLNF